MAKATVEQRIPATQDKVWAVIADPSRNPEWLTLHDRFKGEVPSPLREGSTFSEVSTVMGMTNTINWTVATLTPSSALRLTGSGMAGAQVSFTATLTPDGDATVVVIDFEFSGQMVIGAIGSAIERAATKEVTASLAKLTSLFA
jgi:carbon monoxide dehydrogenase subunit G